MAACQLIPDTPPKTGREFANEFSAVTGQASDIPQALTNHMIVQQFLDTIFRLAPSPGDCTFCRSQIDIHQERRIREVPHGMIPQFLACHDGASLNQRLTLTGGADNTLAPRQEFVERPGLVDALEDDLVMLDPATHEFRGWKSVRA